MQARVLFGSGSNTSSVAGRPWNDGAGEGTGNRLTDGDTTIEDFGGIDGDCHVLTWILIDGDLLTERGPASSSEAARTLLDELGVDMDSNGAE